MEHPYIPELRVKFSNLNEKEKALVVDIILSRIPVIYNIYEFLGDRTTYSHIMDNMYEFLGGRSTYSHIMDNVYVSYYKRGWTLAYAEGTWWFIDSWHRKERYEPAKGRHPKPYTET